MIARAARTSRPAPARRRRRAGSRGEWARGARVLGLLLLAALTVRTLVVMPRTIPSESMMPALVPGDYVAVAKWPYGWSRFSLPVAPPWPRGRLLGALPARGDVVVFRGPDGREFVKRVAGLPGDVVALRDGRLLLNGRAVPRARVADFVWRNPGADDCRSIAPPPYGRIVDTRGHAACRLPRYRETLPGGRGYDVIDQGATMQDDMAPATVPAGRLFLLGDNRDRSDDSRFPVAAGGIGLVPLDALEGRVGAVLFSARGGALRLGGGAR